MRVYRPESTRAIPSGAKINKGTVNYKGRDGRPVRAVLTTVKGIQKMRVAQGVWHVGFRDGFDREQDIAAFEHEGATRTLAAKIQTLIDLCGEPMPTDLRQYINRLPVRIVSALQECGLLRNDRLLAAKPLAELVDMYEQALRNRGRSSRHVHETPEMVRQVFDGCRFEFWRDIEDQTVEAHLRDLREGERDVSYRRSNAYLTACQSFCTWIVDDRKWSWESPLRGIQKFNVKEDPRHTRRALTVEELKTLLAATAAGPERYGMSGVERCLLYTVAAMTGLRAGELRRLRIGDFDFQGHTVTVRGTRATKAKATRQQALPITVCEALHEFFGTRPPDAKAFGGSYKALTDRTADMVKEDLAMGGISYADDQGNVFDFHSLRGEFASLLIASGADIKETQELLRHSTAALTLEVYTRLTAPNRKALAVAKLPDLSQPVNSSEREIYGELYAQDESHRTKSDNIGHPIRNDTPENAFLNEAEGARTLNLRIDSPMHDGEKPALWPQKRHFEQSDPLSFSTVIRADPDLDIVNERWPHLSAELRRAIIRMVE